MKVVLVRPPSFRTQVVIPNLGLGYLASTLRDRGHDVSILDCARDGLSHQDFARELPSLAPELIGVQVFTCDVPSARRCLEIAKGWSAEVVTVIGGPHPTGAPRSSLGLLGRADYGFRGEAELGLPMLLARLAHGRLPNREKIPGLIYKSGGEILVNEAGAVPDLDTLPIPCWELIDPRKYPEARHGYFSRTPPIAPMVTTRGCPFLCTYCTARVTGGAKNRRRSARNIVDEIELLYGRFGIREVHFEDDNFTLHKDHVLEFCDELMRRKITISWALPNGVRLETLDEQVLQAMEQAGCYAFAVGIESGSQRILDLMKRNTTLERIERQINLITTVTDIRLTGFFMLGYPTETPADLERTIQYACRLPLHRAQFGYFLPLPGTEAFGQVERAGGLSLEGMAHEDYQVDRIAYLPEGMTRKELHGAMRRAFWRFYSRPRTFMDLLGGIHSLSQLWSILSRGLSAIK